MGAKPLLLAQERVTAAKQAKDSSVNDVVVYLQEQMRQREGYAEFVKVKGLVLTNLDILKHAAFVAQWMQNFRLMKCVSIMILFCLICMAEQNSKIQMVTR